VGFYALDARDGKLQSKFPVGGRVISGPMTYSLGGEHVEVAAGDSLFVFVEVGAGQLKDNSPWQN